MIKLTVVVNQRNGFFNPIAILVPVIACPEFPAQFLPQAGHEGLAGLVDRLGKRRAVLGGFILLLLALLLLPRLSGTLATALGGMALFICTFEFALVSLVPLVSEIVPSARGSVLALNVAAMSVGRIIATLTAPRLWAAGGLPANALASAAMLAVGIVVLWRVVREK